MPNQIQAHISFLNSQREQVQATLVHVDRNAVVCEVYNPYSVVQLSEVLENFRIHRGDQAIYDGRAVVSNLVNTGIMLIVSATMVDPWSDLAVAIDAGNVDNDVTEFINDWQQLTLTLDPEFQVSVGKLRSFLEDLSRWMEHGELLAHTETDNFDERNWDFFQTVRDRTQNQLTDLYGTFEHKARDIDPEIIPIHRHFAQREIHPLTLCSPFVHRTYSKPLGYAGDYQMVNMILGEPARGQTTYAKIINNLYLSFGPAVGHRNRIDRLVELLIDETNRKLKQGSKKLKILNVGCGPAQELQRFIRTSDLSNHIDVELVDFNSETIAFCEEMLSAACSDSGNRPELKYTNKSINGLLKEASGRGAAPQPEFDLIYCAGLFDYLSDRICQRILALFRKLALPDALIVATNVDSSNPIKLNMELLLEWHLIYRNHQSMSAIAPDNCETKVYSESSGMNLFLECRVPE